MSTVPPEDHRRLWQALTGLSETVVELQLTSDDLGERVEEVEEGSQRREEALAGRVERLEAAVATLVEEVGALQHRCNRLLGPPRF